MANCKNTTRKWINQVSNVKYCFVQMIRFIWKHSALFPYELHSIQFHLSISMKIRKIRQTMRWCAYRPMQTGLLIKRLSSVLSCKISIGTFTFHQPIVSTCTDVIEHFGLFLRYHLLNLFRKQTATMARYKLDNVHIQCKRLMPNDIQQTKCIVACKFSPHLLSDKAHLNQRKLIKSVWIRLFGMSMYSTEWNSSEICRMECMRVIRFWKFHFEKSINEMREIYIQIAFFISKYTWLNDKNGHHFSCFPKRIEKRPVWN